MVGIVATAGATNTGVIDDLEGVAGVCAEFGAWLHVDAAYGGAALLAERARPLFAGIEHADSVTIDPHKWLFTPFDCAAVLYRDPELARASHAQRAPYLDVVAGPHYDNPADYALHLSRRARGLPLWMSLVAHGRQAYARSVTACLDLADHAVERIADSGCLSLAAPPHCPWSPSGGPAGPPPPTTSGPTRRAARVRAGHARPSWTAGPPCGSASSTRLRPTRTSTDPRARPSDSASVSRIG